jgi:hypothetical protein
MKNIREHPTAQELAEMDGFELARYARRERDAYVEQKQTAAARLLDELADRVYIP